MQGSEDGAKWQHLSLLTISRIAVSNSVLVPDERPERRIRCARVKHPLSPSRCPRVTGAQLAQQHRRESLTQAKRSGTCPRFGGVGETGATVEKQRRVASDGINDAAIRIFGPPLTQFITGTDIQSNLHHGIDRGWRADLQPDFVAGNTFASVAACKQTVPRTAAGVCPQVLPCP